MFKRKWSALPPDPEFPSDLKGLGYFINKDDEVRSIENEDNYFKFFVNRNPRVCERQRFAMNQAIQEEIHMRLLLLGLSKVLLPLSAGASSQPQLPIFMSADIAEKSRVVVIFGETNQDLGVLAHRVLGGPGGIEKGSLVSVVKAILQKQSSPTDPSPPGVILANTGELIWWPKGGRTLSNASFDGAPMHSAAHIGNNIDPKLNRVCDNESPAAHVKYIFESVIPAFARATAGLDVVGLGDGADVVESYLNSKQVWERVGVCINCFASVGGQFPEWEVRCDGLRKFLQHHARAYVPSSEPLGLVLSGPSGNPQTTTFTSLGCPVFSAGESVHVETLFITCHPTVLDWLQEVADTPAKNKPYTNPLFTVVYSDAPNGSNDWTDWTGDENGADGETNNHGDESAGVCEGVGKLKIVTRDGEMEVGGAEGDVEQATGEQNDSASGDTEVAKD